MSYDINTPIGDSLVFEDSQITYLISGSVTDADIGKAVSWDTTATRTVKLAADGDVIIGRLWGFTNRTQEKVKTCVVSRRFSATLPIKAGLTLTDVVAVGKTVVGAGNGEVRAQATANHSANVVVAVNGLVALVEKI